MPANASTAFTIRQGDGEDLMLAQYRLLSVLGQGGMGTVYRAEHSQLRREVAVKVMTRLADGNDRLVSRFYAEARAVAKLQHPNIVTCFDVGRAHKPGPTPVYRDYFVMELIVGQDLYHLVREKGPLTPQRACDLFRQVAEALSEAHRHCLIHRDIKPSNIIVTPDWQAKVLDFGLARVPSRNVTEPGTLLGTIGFMAPEQARDPHTVDGRADLFSLGASMYWALTGREPFPETGNTLKDLQVRMTTAAVPVRQIRPEVPLEISELIERLMDLDPDKRYRMLPRVCKAWL
jgi:eukaryotic-like serine/threonine-protein kinase